MAGPTTWSEFITQINAILDNFALTVGEDVVSSNVAGVTDFSKATGAYVNSPIIPWTASTITLNETGDVRGGISVIWYKGDILTKDSFTGGVVTMFSGINEPDVLCRVCIDYDKSSKAYGVNIQTGFTGDIPNEEVDEGPATMAIINVADGGADSDVPATMAITNITDRDLSPPATMTITEITTV